ncbi:FliC/FljB family flagellin [Halomonas sp. WWR20]
MSVINTNITSMIAQQNLNSSKGDLTTAMERLSSGLRINSAKDDAAGQAIANRMSSQITGLSQAQRNANDGISVAQTAEGGLNQVNDNLQRIRELTVQAQNGTNSQDDLASIQNEIGQRLEEIDRISEQTSFNGVKVLGEDDSVKIQVGAKDNEAINIATKKIDRDTLELSSFSVANSLKVGESLTEIGTDKVTGLASGQTLHEELDAGGVGTGDYVVKEGNNTYRATVTTGAVSIATASVAGDTGTITENIRVDAAGTEYVEVNDETYAADSAAGTWDAATTVDLAEGTSTADPLQKLDDALKMVDSYRSDLGAIQNRFESAITNLQTNETNLSAARSRIEDADYADEVSNMTRAQILQQAGTSVLAQANQVPQSVLSLLG